MLIDILEDKEKRNKVRFITFIIPEFARSYKINKSWVEIYDLLKHELNIN